MNHLKAFPLSYSQQYLLIFLLFENQRIGFSIHILDDCNIRHLMYTRKRELTFSTVVLSKTTSLACSPSPIRHKYNN